MAHDEKLPLLQPPVQQRTELRRRRSFYRTAWIAFRGCLVLWSIYASLTFFWLGWITRRVEKDHERFGPTDYLQCLQVEALAPVRQTAALSMMDDYIDTEEFRNESVGRWAGAVQIPSQSFDDMGPIGKDGRWDIMYDMAVYLETTFPLVHSTLQLEKVNTHGLLFTWHGSNESLKPTVLMAHQDVVPVPESTITQWTYPPWSGAYDGTYVWGRGASDCKNTLTAILEAVELLVGAGFKPKRTLILSFGFDEEISGYDGAGHLAPFLLERYGKDGAAMIVDEGAGIASAWGATFAIPAVGEKGYIDVNVTVRMPGGHSSVPPPHNGIGVMSEFITMVEDNRYEPHMYSQNPFLSLLACGATHAPNFPQDWKNDLFAGKIDELASEIVKEDEYFKYLFTTSVAVDVIEGGVKVNALPERTTTVINHRVNIGEHPSAVQDKLTKLASIIAEKYNLTLHAFADEDETPSSITLKAAGQPLEPAPVTPTEVDRVTPYAILSGTTRALYEQPIIMAPGLMTGNTDTKFYWNLTSHIFRYIPGWDPVDDETSENAHTVDEKASAASHIKNVKWFSLFIRNMDEADLN